jgi:hypothetical protein
MFSLGVDNDDFDEKFSLAKTLTSILDSSGATTNNSNTQLRHNAHHCWHSDQNG